MNDWIQHILYFMPFGILILPLGVLIGTTLTILAILIYNAWEFADMVIKDWRWKK